MTDILTSAPAEAGTGGPPDRADRIRDLIRVYEITAVTPGLPVPFGGPDRAAFYFTDGEATAAREVVATAKQAFAGALGAVFGWRDIWTSGGARRQYKATLASGLDIVLMAKAEHMQDEDGTEDAGVRELAEVAA